MAVEFSIQSEFKYEIFRLIYEGSMGAVYEAEQQGAQGFVKNIAIKIIKPTVAGQPQFIENFIGEAKLVADLIHTNIVQIYHLGESSRMMYAKLGANTQVLNRYMTPGSQVYYMAMELINGVNLTEFCRQLSVKKRPLPIELAVFIVSRVARALAYAHVKKDREGKLLGLVHRDITPKNIMIAFEGDTKVIDFGIAKAKGQGLGKEGEEVTGKPEYMSPEQSSFQVTDGRSDIFSAGVVLLELLIGRNPFVGSTPAATRERIQKLPLPDFATVRQGVDESLNKILHRALARDPAGRFQTAEEFMKALEFQIYGKGYGPTNETVGKFIRELFDVDQVAPPPAQAQPAATT